nr:hypothetical protein CFP56_10496 [Quercus suber]
MQEAAIGWEARDLACADSAARVESQQLPSRCLLFRFNASLEMCSLATNMPECGGGNASRQIRAEIPAVLETE